jgi:hypothetical protein
MAVVLVLMHIAASVVYYIYIQTNDADTALYYFDAYGFARHSTALGTILLIQIVQGLRRAMGGSYLDYFLLFQSAGFWGIAHAGLNEAEVPAMLQVGDVAVLARREIIETDDLGADLDQALRQVGADKPGASRNDHFAAA